MQDLLNSIMASADYDALGAQLGISAADSEKALGVVLPALSGATQHNVRQAGGLGSLVEAIRGGSFERHADSAGGFSFEDAMSEGNDILGDLLGTKDNSRQVAAKASEETGIDPSIFKKLLPIAASLLMAYLAKQGKQADAQAPAPESSGGGGIGDILGKMLDKDGDGGFLDDILGGAVGGMFGGK